MGNLHSNNSMFSPFKGRTSLVKSTLVTKIISLFYYKRQAPCAKIFVAKPQTYKTQQQAFIESMAEAAKSVSDYFASQNKQIVYITVMNFLSVDCDCDAHQTDPVMADLGIIASTDPVANDQAFVDMIYASTDPGAKKLQERIDRQMGRHILPYAESIGLGTTKYELIEL